MLSCPKKIIGLLLLSLVFNACRKKNIPQKIPTKTTENAPSSKNTYQKREFRGAWIATVNNIDWPSRKGLSSEMQQQEFRNILDFDKKLGINAVMVQVRDAADAFYAKSNEPWSEWLTGEQGKAPEPFYDPMRFMIQETHQRGIEFHAWLNMNRGAGKAAKSIAKGHITLVHPEWFLMYGGVKLFNLGIPEVREYITNIVSNIVKTYDVDGIHFDDYFYPYTIVGEKLNDNETFEKYNNGFSNIEDWRRNNVDITIEGISRMIRSEKPRLKFGISPFGVWRNKAKDATGSDTQAGQTSYDDLFADTKKWLKNGWIDYIAPQVYFSFENPKVPYRSLVAWWRKNGYNRHLYIGHGIYRVEAKSKEKGWSNPSQIPSQVRYNRLAKEIQGSIFYSNKSLINNQLGVSDSLKNIFTAPALLPTMPWKDNVPPNPPKNLSLRKTSEKEITITWQVPDVASDGENANAFVLYRFEEHEEIDLDNPKYILQIIRNEGVLNYVDKSFQPSKNYVYLITALDRLQNESEPSEIAKLK